MFTFTGIAAQFQSKPELTAPPNDNLGFNTAVSFQIHMKAITLSIFYANRAQIQTQLPM